MAESPRRAQFEIALLAVGVAALFVCLPHALAGDDFTRYDDIERLLHHGGLSDSRYSLIMPVVSAPLLLLGEVVRSPDWWAARFNVVVVATGIVCTWLLTRGRIDAGVFRRTVLMLLFASFLTNRLRDYNAEVLTAMLVVVGLLVVWRGRDVLGWSLVVVGVANTPAAIVGLALVVAAEAVRRRRMRALWPVVAAAALIVAEDWIRRGGPLTTGYSDNHGVHTILPYSGKPGFSYPFVLGLLSILFSFGRGLVFFTPGLVLWLDASTRRVVSMRRVVVALLLFVAGLVLVYAKWWAWYGGLAWGPRFFVLAAVPAAILVTTRLAHAGESVALDALTLLVLTLSAWVGWSGAIADLSQLGICSRNDYALESLCWYVPEFSSLWRPVLDFPPVSAREGVVVALCILVYVYLATPLVVALARRLRFPAEWAHRWRL